MLSLVSLGLISNGCGQAKTNNDSNDVTSFLFSLDGFGHAPPVAKAFDSDTMCSYIPGVYPVNPLEGDSVSSLLEDTIEEVGPEPARPRMREAEDVLSVLDPDSFSGFPRAVLSPQQMRLVRRDHIIGEINTSLDQTKEDLYLQEIEEGIARENKAKEGLRLKKSYGRPSKPNRLLVFEVE